MRHVLRFVALVVLCGCAAGASAQPLTDPGPFWAGITDTTSLGDHIRAHVLAAETLLDEVRSVEGERTARNTALPFYLARARLNEASALANIGLNAHPDPDFRSYAQVWKARLAARTAPLATDPALYEAFAALDLSRFDPEARYVVEQELQAYRRRGVTLSEVARARMDTIRAQIDDVGTQFQRNIFTDTRAIKVHPDSLGGLPPDWIAANASGAPDAEGLVTVAITPANFQPVLAFARSADLRERTARAFFTQGYPQNLPLIDSLRVLRDELAGLLGFDSWADYALAPTMAASPQRVSRFLDEVDEASEAAAEREGAALLALRRQEEPGATSMPYEHSMYWSNKLRQRDYGFDEQAMRPYFPYASVRDGVLETYEEAFGLEFRSALSMPVWSPEAEPYEVYEDGALVGRVVLDMHPREGKFGHCGAFDLRSGGGRLPEMAVICNVPGGTGDRPGLLEPGQVRTFFHEFGHVIHFLLAARQPLMGDFEPDFVEAPSQLLEAWAMDYGVLRRFARHYQTGEPIPADLVAAYRRADGFGRAQRARESLWLSDLALNLYLAPSETEPTEAVERRAARYLVTPPPDYLHIAARLPHLYGYSSNYYTYAWSEVIARDLLTGFNRNDLLDPAAGRRYRDLVLAPTGTAPSAVLIERFLGRPFDADAWRLWLGDGESGE